MKIKTPELLAPAGGRKQLEAAINNGADAVYMGGALFNARMKADNFSRDDLKSAVDFAHERAVKVYVTLNTLIKDSELPKAFEYACTLYEDGADAVILQDLGLADLIHRYIPELPMHMSTQGTVYNRSGVMMAADMGFSRVVPARELSLEEIQRLCAGKTHAEDKDVTGGMMRPEIEVFIHGALCMCYSGQCQMSRLLGRTRSGNRGLCAQPCRLPYTDDRGRTSYALSPRDLCTIGDIPDLCRAGVNSFKIEGRLKSPEYVATVTRIYRKYLDILCASDTCAEGPDPKDIDELLRIFNRGGFTKGYLYGNPGKDILSGRSPKNQGVPAGTVTAVRKASGKGAKSGRMLVDVKLCRNHLTGEMETINAGDGVELPETGNVVTYAEKLNGNMVRIGDFRTDPGASINIGDRVCKVTDRKFMEQIMSLRALKKTEVSMTFTAHVGKLPELKLAADGKTFAATGETAVEKALRHPADPERIKKQLSRMGEAPFAVSEIRLDVEHDAMIPVSAVNGLRRQAVEQLLHSRRDTGRSPVNEETVNIALEEIRECTETGRNPEAGACRYGSAVLVPLEKFMEGECGEECIPYILNVSKGRLDAWIGAHFDEIAAAVRKTGIALGNLGWMKEFLDAGVRVYGDYGLNVYNMQAEKFLGSLGVETLAWSDEFSRDGRHCTNEGGEPVPAPARIPRELENVPLMITEHPFMTGHLTDRKGAVHKILKWYSEDKYLIF